MTKEIPFLKITGEDKKVLRIAAHMHAYDFIKVMCNTQKKPGEVVSDYEKRVSNKIYNIWKRFEKAAPEVTQCVKKHDFYRGGIGNTPIMSLEVAKKLIGWLPVKVYDANKVIDLLEKHLVITAVPAAAAPVMVGAAPVVVPVLASLPPSMPLHVHPQRQWVPSACASPALVEQSLLALAVRAKCCSSSRSGRPWIR